MKPTDPDVYSPAPAHPLPASAAVVTDALAPLVTPERLARIREVVANRTRRIVPVLDALVDPHNVSAVLRSADAFGLQAVHVIGGERGFFAAKRVSKGADRWLDLVRHETSYDCVDHLSRAGYEVWVASMHGERAPEQLRDRGRVAMVFGNEHRGPSEAMLSGASGTFCIPMYGFVESLNVSVAAAVSLCSARAGAPGDLSDDEQAELVAMFLMRSVRDARRIVLEHGRVQSP